MIQDIDQRDRPTMDKFDPYSMDTEEQEDDYLIRENLPAKTSTHSTLYSWLFASWGLIPWTILLLIFLREWPLQNTSFGTYERGFVTDFGPVQQEIGLIEYHFTGSLYLDDHGVLQRETDPTKPQYAGEPSPEIDKSWSDLLTVMEIIVTGDEAKEVEGKTTQGQEEGEWRMSLDVYHSLHCLNSIRKSIDPLYYNPSGERKYYYRRHLDHCLDYLRQVIQCQSDLTPLTYYHEPKYNTSIPVFGQPHTCRDFSRIHEWALARDGHMIPGEEG